MIETVELAYEPRHACTMFEASSVLICGYALNERATLYYLPRRAA